MASVRELKKDINYVLGDIIDATYVWELLNPGEDIKKSEAIADEAVSVFDELITKVNEKNVENRKKHFKQINLELEQHAKALVDKINAL